MQRFVLCSLAFGLLLDIAESVSSESNPIYAKGPWRSSLDREKSCWIDSNCNRVMTVSHGGDWNLSAPYDSLPAFQQAFTVGADAIKGDFRVAKDNIGVVMHSSPVEIYESFNCYGKYVEQMTSSECSKCQMALTSNHFLTVPELLTWADGRINVMLCVKETTDIPRAISTLIENNASHRAFLEVGVDEILDVVISDLPGWTDVYFVVILRNEQDINRIIANMDSLQSRVFLLEFQEWWDWEGVEDLVDLAEKSGFRTFAPSRDGMFTATVANHLRLFQTGFSVAYTYNLENAITARQIVNKENGVIPP